MEPAEKPKTIIDGDTLNEYYQDILEGKGVTSEEYTFDQFL